MTNPDDRLALEFISVLGMSPPAFIATAVKLGVGRIGLAAAPFTANPHGFAAWDLRRDPALVQDTRDALSAYGITVSLGEGFMVSPGQDIADSVAAMDVLAQLGAPCFNAVVIEQDRARAADQFACFAQMAAAHDAIATVEFLPMMWPATLGEAIALIDEVGAPNGRVLIDAMHLFRSGGSAADVAAADPAKIGYVQICDVPMPARTSNYGEEAKHDRLCPGDGDLPLGALIAALPPTVTIGLETPLLTRARAGEDAAARLAPCVAAARALLAG